MFEYDPWADLLDDLAADLAPADVVALPAIAGGSPGLFDDLSGWFGAIAGDSLGPVLDFLAGKVDGVVRAAWAAVESALSVFARLFFRVTLGAFAAFIPARPLEDFREWDRSARFSAGTWLSATFQLLRYLWARIRDDGLIWLRDRLFDLLGFALDGFGDLVSWLKAHTTNFLNWIYANVRGLLGFLADGFPDLVSWFKAHTNNFLNWIGDRVKGLLGFALDGFGDLISWFKAHTNNFLNWIGDRVRGLLGFALDGFGDLISWFKAHTNNFLNWIGDRVRGLLGFALDGFGDLVSWFKAHTTNFLNWIYNNIAQPILKKLEDIAAQLVAGGEAVLNFLVDAFKEVFLGPVQEMIDTVEFKLAIPGKLLDGQYPDLRAFLADLTDPAPAVLGAIVGPILLALVISLVVASVMTILLTPLAEPHRQEIEAGVGSQLMTITNIHEAWNRDLLTEGAAVDQFRKIGLSGDRLTATQALRFRLPPLTDLTRMAVREVFDPAQRSALTLDADYPPDLTGHARAIGLEEVWARNYWAAHWDLPSPTQGFEMLHRGIISEGELRDLLRALDFAPVWRGRLQETSYNPLTRVDVRRMYAAGVLTEAEVNRAYHDIGYNDQNAARLTEFTKRNYAPGDKTQGVVNRELTASQIRTAYRRHIVTRDDALTRLVEIGYDAEEADFQLALDDYQLANNPLTDAGAPVRDLTIASIRQAYREGIYSYDQAVLELETIGFLGAEADVMLALDDLQLARDLTNAEIALVRERFIGFTIDAAGGRAELARAGVAPRRQDLLLAEWAAEAERGTRRLTVAEVFRLLARGSFNADQAFAYLLRLGYNQADADALFQLRAGV